MKLQFDPNQTFQLDAVVAVMYLFDGQPQGAPDYAVIHLGEMGGLFAGQDQTELGVGNRLRQFATSNTLQILIINIDAFRKNFTGTEEEQKSNVIYKESDRLSGRQPLGVA